MPNSTTIPMKATLGANTLRIPSRRAATPRKATVHQRQLWNFFIEDLTAEAVHRANQLGELRRWRCRCPDAETARERRPTCAFARAPRTARRWMPTFSVGQRGTVTVSYT